MLMVPVRLTAEPSSEPCGRDRLRMEKGTNGDDAGSA